MIARERDCEELIRSVYPELREIAARLLRRERDHHTLQRTALVNEAFVRLFRGQLNLLELAPEKFLALAAHQMRHVLIDYGRKHGAKKRGKDFSRVPLFDSASSLGRDEDSLLALDQALNKLSEVDERAVSVTELKYFAGFTNEETAEILGVSDGTVESTWQFARLWLFRELSRPSSAVYRKSPETCLSESFQRA